MNNNQFGRSMIEMLGVLAIIGVLSVGAIAGYQKAMLKYKLNKQAQQLNQVINAMIVHLGDFKDEQAQGDVITSSMFVKLGEIPKEMIKNSNIYFYDIFNSEMFTLYNPKYNTDELYYYIDITDNSLSLPICRNFFNIAKEYQEQIYQVSILSGHGTDNQLSKSYRGLKYCNQEVPCVTELSLTNIDKLCTEHLKQSDTHFKIFLMNN